MTTPIESVVRIAASPAQAKVFVAMLQGEGIPARVDGDTLADEFAASRRLMNLLGTSVLVPTASLARAREILQPVDVDPAELERQALAATLDDPLEHRERHPPTSPTSPRRLAIAITLLVLAIAGALAFVLT